MADRDKMGAPGYQEFKAEELRTAEMGGVRAVIIAGKEAPNHPTTAPNRLPQLTHSLTHSLVASCARTQTLYKPRVIVIVMGLFGS